MSIKELAEKMIAAVRGDLVSDVINKETTGYGCIQAINPKNITDICLRLIELEKLVFVPGQFSCKKCGFFVFSQTLYMKIGDVGPNNEPQDCSNGCGPMWKASYKELLREISDTAEKIHTEKLDLKSRLDDMKKHMRSIQHSANLPEEFDSKDLLRGYEKILNTANKAILEDDERAGNKGSSAQNSRA